MEIKYKKIFLPHQEVQLVLQGDAYDRDIGKEIVRHVHSNKSEKYIGTKLNIQ